MHNENQDDHHPFDDEPSPLLVLSFILIFSSVFLMAAASHH